MARHSSVPRLAARPSKEASSRYTIGAVAKAFDILDVLAENSKGLSLTEIGQRLALPKSSVYRYLVTLEERGYVTRSAETDEYRLGLRLFELGSQVIAQVDLAQEAPPLMRHLVETFRETVNLGILAGGEVVYLAILESPQSIRMVATPGHHDYAHSTALGKAILAYLPAEKVDEIIAFHGLPARTPGTVAITVGSLREELARVRDRGYAVDNIENEEGIRCVGAPIFNHRREAVAAISMSGPASRMPPSLVEEMGKELIKATASISQRLGYQADLPDAQ